jgi:adenylylsulfate kinase-like enzyme
MPSPVTESRRGPAGTVCLTGLPAAGNSSLRAGVGAGVIAIVALVSPYAEDRRRAREIHDARGLPFLEVWVDTPLDVCQERDPKGLYARAGAGELAGMTGIGAPYEAPVQPEFRISGRDQTPEQGAADVIERLSG